MSEQFVTRRAQGECRTMLCSRLLSEKAVVTANSKTFLARERMRGENKETVDGERRWSV